MGGERCGQSSKATAEVECTFTSLTDPKSITLFQQAVYRPGAGRQKKLKVTLAESKLRISQDCVHGVDCPPVFPTLGFPHLTHIAFTFPTGGPAESAPELPSLRQSLRWATDSPRRAATT